MARPKLLNAELIAKLTYLVKEKCATPQEVAVLLGVSRNTAYNYIHELGLPVRLKGDHLKFYDPAWELPEASVPSGSKFEQWGPWVRTDKVPHNEAHPHVWQRSTTLPLSVMVMAQHVLRKIPNLDVPCIIFKDGNPSNVALDNMEIREDRTEEYLEKVRLEDLRSSIGGVRG